MPYLSNINLLIPIFVIIQKPNFFAVVYFNGLYPSSKKAFVNVIINPQFLTIVSHNPLVNVRAHTNYKFITLVGVVNLLFLLSSVSFLYTTPGNMKRYHISEEDMALVTLMVTQV